MFLRQNVKNTSALGEVLSSLVSATCFSKRERVCRGNIDMPGRHLSKRGFTIRVSRAPKLVNTSLVIVPAAFAIS